MTPWLSERWACAPTNDGRNFAEPHRWAVMEPRPLCFGLREVSCHAAGFPCEDCGGQLGIWFDCPQVRRDLRTWASWERRTAALMRSYIREAHELRSRITTLEAENVALREARGGA